MRIHYFGAYVRASTGKCVCVCVCVGMCSRPRPRALITQPGDERVRSAFDGKMLNIIMIRMGVFALALSLTLSLDHSLSLSPSHSRGIPRKKTCDMHIVSPQNRGHAQKYRKYAKLGGAQAEECEWYLHSAISGGGGGACGTLTHVQKVCSLFMTKVSATRSSYCARSS